MTICAWGIRVSAGADARPGFPAFINTSETADSAIGELNLTDRAGAQGEVPGGLIPLSKEAIQLTLIAFPGHFEGRRMVDVAFSR